MKIYINSNYEIKAINSADDETLTEIEVDRELVFGNMSDFMILNYCYKPSNNGYSVYPAKDYSMLELLDKEAINKILILKEENEKQDELIDTTLLATDEMYMMLEPLLASQVNLTSEYISRMAAMYVAMVQRGLKTIDEVPVRYREEVRAIIEN